MYPVHSLQSLGWYFTVSVFLSWKQGFTEWFEALAFNSNSHSSNVLERVTEHWLSDSLMGWWKETHTSHFPANKALAVPHSAPSASRVAACLPRIFWRRRGRRGRCCCLFNAKHLAVIGWGTWILCLYLPAAASSALYNWHRRAKKDSEKTEEEENPHQLTVSNIVCP